MFLLRSSYFLILIVVLSSCKNDDASREKVFFDLDSLITAQEKYLAERRPTLFKIADLDGQLDSTSVSDLDTTGWSAELDIFRQLDLNKKSVNRRNYAIQKDIRDPYSNLLICKYVAQNENTSDEMRIKNVNNYYQDRLTNPRKIEGEFFEQNALYTSTRSLVMELNNIHDKTLVTRYIVKGTQKMILGDSVRFEIIGTVTH